MAQIHRHWLFSLLAPFLIAAALAGCSRDASNQAPPRETTPIAVPQETSAIAVPIITSLAELQRLANAKVPATLITIDETKPACLRIKVIGSISCKLVGRVTRGPIRIGGAGDAIVATMPVSASVAARDVAHFINKTATADAIVTVTARMTSIGNWQPRAKVSIDYAWTKKPGVDFLGQRIGFANKADPALAKLIAQLEARIPGEIAKLQPREKLAQAWAQGFTTVSLNARNPPVWLRITPKQLRFRGYLVDKRSLTLNLGASALTETFVGNRPADPAPTPLPPPAPRQIGPDAGFRFHLPVVADYAELEPVLEKALHKLSKKPMTLPGIGAVEPEFSDVTIYATTGNRLAIGLKMRVATPGRWIDARGTVWVTGQPFNTPGTRLVTVRDLRIDGNADSPAFRLLLAVARSPSVNAEIGNALSQDFERDFAKLLDKAGKAISEKPLGPFVLAARIDHVHNGLVYPAGQGLFMPVDAVGTASIRFVPKQR
ncbi:MAG: DUF4403 family protein [Sandarakinorhabdus sp.]|nr:DUF4403 family protein [Sandarakinorhabdus sp.]